jgi:hypothetical protein
MSAEGAIAMTCDACDAELHGASKADAVQAGWAFHFARIGVEFVMCPDCEERYALFRRARTWSQVGRGGQRERAA